MSFTWKIVNLDGDTLNLDTRIDVEIDATGRLTKLEKSAAIEQRVRVATLAKRGRRILSPRFGSFVKDHFRTKSLASRMSSFLTSDLLTLMKDLQAMQSELQRRITLDKEEILYRILSIDSKEIANGHFICRVSVQTLASANSGKSTLEINVGV